MGAGLGLIGTGLNAAGTISAARSNQQAQREQQEAMDQWHMYQLQMRNQEMLRQRALGFKATSAFNQNLYDDVGAQAQMAQQQKEQQRLVGAYGSGTSAVATPASDASIQAGSQSAALTGQSGGDGEFRTDLARRLNNAASDARGRIEALATMQSMGDSQFGIGNTVPQAFTRTAQTINQMNNYRRGSLNAYGVERAVEPVKINAGGQSRSGLYKAAGGLLSGIGSGGGGMGF